jgi:serine/threonine-protein kinase
VADIQLVSRKDYHVPDLIGQTLKSRYRVESLLGRGGMAEVYKAWDTWRNYHVAVKVMREDLAEDLEFLRRFRREATALAKLAHENIVRFYAFEQDDLTAFIVMDYVEGTTLRAEIARADGPLPPERVLAITRQVCAALNYAHLEGVIHRDVKPGNIMLRPDGRVLLSDFGISKAIDAATATAATVSVGTPAYMSPEQCAGQSPDGRTDVYSLGVVVYEMLAGRRPFVGDLAPETITNTTERIRWEQMHASPPALRKLNPAVPREVEAAVMTALAKDREQRWPTVTAFGEELEQRMGADKRMVGAAVGGQAREGGSRGGRRRRRR